MDGQVTPLPPAGSVKRDRNSLYDGFAPYVGNVSQLLQIRKYRLDSGAGEGMPCVDVQNTAGLGFTLSADRALDIIQARYRGVNLSPLRRGGPIASTRLRGPHEADSHLGMLFTCGFENTGMACESDGVAFRQHGSIGVTPAENVRVEEYLEDGVPAAAIRGRVEQCRCGDEHLRLERSCFVRDDRAAIRLVDRVLNTGNASAPLLVMYHFNVGYPLLSESAELDILSSAFRPKDEASKSALARPFDIPPPDVRFTPQVLYHTLSPDAEGRGGGEIRNPDLGLGLRIRVDCRQLPYMTQWRKFVSGEYVLGLEPCNQMPLTRRVLKEKGLLPTIEPGEERLFEVEMEIF